MKLIQYLHLPKTKKCINFFSSVKLPEAGGKQPNEQAVKLLHRQG